MEANQNASGDELTGMQKEAQLRALMQRTGYQLRQVRRFDWTMRAERPLLPGSGKRLFSGCYGWTSNFFKQTAVKQERPASF